MNTDKLIKELALLADSCDSNYALEVNGYSQGVNDAIDLVKKLTIPVVIPCDHRYHSRNGRYMLYEGWCEKCGTDCHEV